MKTSIYINKENEKGLANTGMSRSSVINDALEMYFNAISFDCAELRKKKKYRLVVFRLPESVGILLEQLKKNYNFKAVNEFIMGLILRGLKIQTGRKKFPDRLYINLKTLNGWLSDVLEKHKRLNK